jgi:hypothetical protein
LRTGKSQISQIKLQAHCEVAPVRNSLRRNKKIRNVTVFIGFLLLIGVHRLLGQESSRPLLPTEAYKAALAPFTETRNQLDDLTEADKFALCIGIAQASRDCLALSSDVSPFASDAKELFDWETPGFAGMAVEV